MEAIKTGDKALRVHFSYNGKKPFGFHPDPNKLFGIKNNLLSHTGETLWADCFF